MKVVGLDLSLTSPGLAAAYSGQLVEVGNPKSKGRRGALLAERADRLSGLGDVILSWVESHDPDLVVVEAPSYGSRFGSPHDRSGLWWLVVTGLRSHEYPYPVAEVAPQSRAKYATGRGNSKKDVVAAAACHLYGEGAFPGVLIANDDVADAAILAAMGSRFLGYPMEGFELPADNLVSMDAVVWPSI